MAAGVPLDVFVTAMVTLLELPAQSGSSARADRTESFTLRGRGSMRLHIRRPAGSYDRAEIIPGDHALAQRRWLVGSLAMT